MEFISVGWNRPYREDPRQRATGGDENQDRPPATSQPPCPIVAPVLLVGGGPNPFVLEKQAKEVLAAPCTEVQQGSVISSFWVNQQLGTSTNSPVANNVKLISFLPLRNSWLSLSPKSIRGAAALVYLYDSEYLPVASNVDEAVVDPLEEFEAFLSAQLPSQFPRRMMICVARMSAAFPGATARRLITQDELTSAVDRFFGNSEMRYGDIAQDSIRPIPPRVGKVFDLNLSARKSSSSSSPTVDPAASGSKDLRQYLVDELWHRAWWSSCALYAPRGAVRLPRFGVSPAEECPRETERSADSHSFSTLTSGTSAVGPGARGRGMTDLVKSGISYCSLS